MIPSNNLDFFHLRTLRYKADELLDPEDLLNKILNYLSPSKAFKKIEKIERTLLDGTSEVKARESKIINASVDQNQSAPAKTESS